LRDELKYENNCVKANKKTNCRIKMVRITFYFEASGRRIPGGNLPNGCPTKTFGHDEDTPAASDG
jgi:hypothetical protein